MTQADDVADKVAQFEVFFTNALIVKYGQQLKILRMRPIFTDWRIQDFMTAYAEGGRPPEHFAKCVDHAIDLKLQLYYVTEVDIGAYNRDFYGPLNVLGLKPEDAPPHLLLARLAQDQNIIGKIRVLWERTMNLVYYIENGCEVPGRSKKRAFFKWIHEPKGEKWRWLSPFQPLIEQQDERFRTAEFHKSSVLRTEILKRAIGVDEIMAGVEYFLNGIWANIVAVTAGRNPPHSFEHTVPINMRLTEARRQHRKGSDPA